MKKLFFSIALFWVSLTAQGQVYVQGTPLDSVHSGHYLLVEIGLEIGDNYFVEVEADKELNKKGLNAFDWVSSPNGKRKPFETQTAAINYFFEQGWEIAFVLHADRPEDSRLILKRRKD